MVELVDTKDSKSFALQGMLVQIQLEVMILTILGCLGVGLLGVLVSPSQYWAKISALTSSCASFLCSLWMWFLFQSTTGKFQFTVDLSWWPEANLHLPLGVDGVSLFFVVLTTFLFPLCLLSSWNSIAKDVKAYVACFLGMEILLILVFTVLDLLWFYVFFESVLIPMFVVIGVWGSRQRKIRAAYIFFMYTLVGSLLILGALVYIYYVVGSLDYARVLAYSFSPVEEKWLWLGFFASFASKVPMLPVHIWLPEAHVEAPTAGSVLLAGVLLKLGSYGLLRFSLPLFPVASSYFSPLVMVLASLGVIYTSLTAIRQTDFKRIIAYTSVAHINLVVMGLFSLTIVGVEGAIVQSLSHGFVSSALFLLIGVLYDRYHTRIVKYYGGLVQLMPLYTLFFVFFTMANIALPGTSSFVGEIMLLVGTFLVNPGACFFGATGMVLGGAYSLWLLNRVVYGNLKSQYLKSFVDLTRREFFVLFPLALATLVMGIYPQIFLDCIHASVVHGLEGF